MNTALVTVQQWGNSLAIRVPVSIARALKLRLGLPVELTVADDSIVIKVAGEPKLTLHQKLSSFEPAKHLPFGAYK
jgi:antitoxin MazE